jgi:HTH-type transcriptional regulator / antitoxin HigA
MVISYHAMKANRTFTYDPDYAVPPGETIREQMEHYGWSQQELAIRLDTTAQTINRIFKGEQPITLETANKLERVLGAPARFWNNLELNYREGLTKLADRERQQSDLNWLKTIPVAELRKRNAIPNTKDPVEQLGNVLAFYGVGNVKAWRDLWEEPAVAARRSSCFASHPGAASAWLRLGQLQAQQRACQPYDKARFATTLDQARAFTNAPPESAVPQLIEHCAACGVAVALVPEMPKAPWSGATMWLTPDKVMVLLNLRGKAEDKFWFSFFHEAGHVLHDSKKDLLINDGSENDPREERANDCAAEKLIPVRFNERIRQATSEAEITRLAAEIGVSPGIVAGRYQFLTHAWHRFKALIRTFDWKPQPA